MTSLTAPGPTDTVGPGAPPARRVRHMHGKARTRLEIVLFVAPALILFIGIVIVPVLLAAV
ncbi:MAG: sugar ABC transporter permease, partial [Tetrasphaera sp.]|nr:sugar ABC transporter permease [Tetrasphaera sp.]